MNMDLLFTLQQPPDRTTNVRTESRDTRTVSEKDGGKDQRTEDGKSFRDVLDRTRDELSKTNDARNRSSKDGERVSDEKPVTADSIVKKADELEKKIDQLSGTSKEGIESSLKELKDILEKIKEIVKMLQDSGKNVALDFGKGRTDLMTFLNVFLSAVSEMLAGTQKKSDLANILKNADRKLDSVRQLLSGEKTLRNNDRPVTLTRDGLGLTEPKQEKVKVVDRRTGPGEAVVLKDRSRKPGELVSKDWKVNDAGLKVLNTSRIKDARDTDTGLKNEQIRNSVLSQQVIKSDQNGVRQYASFGTSVSKANLEALMQNVTGRVLVTLRDGKSELKMNLIPPELGKMSLNLRLEDGQVFGKIVVSTPEAKMLFDQNLGDLQRMLQQAGVNIAQMDVSMGGQDSPGEQAGAEKGAAAGAVTAGVTEAGAGEALDAAGSLFYDSSINYIA